MYKAVIFDLDGTLLNTLTDLANAVNFALRSFSFPERTVSEVCSFIGNGVVKLMERATPDGVDAETQEKALAVFREHYLSHMTDSTAAYDGVTELLKELKEAGIKTAVVSNKLHRAVVGLCEEYFPSLIDVALGVGTEEERKPSPVNVLKALDLMNTDCQNTVYIGDSEVDIQTAHGAGLKCIGVTWGFRSKDLLTEKGCDYIADTPEEIKKLVSVISKRASEK